MSILINIPDLKKPTKCVGCPLLHHVEENYDHYDFYVCMVEGWNKNIIKTPMSINDIYDKVLDSCPIKECNDDGFSCRNETIEHINKTLYNNKTEIHDTILYRIALNVAEVADQLAESNGYYMASAKDS